LDTKSTAAGLQIDAQKWQNFAINFINSAGVIQHQIIDWFQGAASGYVDKISGASIALANTPLLLDSTHGFVSGAGL